MNYTQDTGNIRGITGAKVTGRVSRRYLACFPKVTLRGYLFDDFFASYYRGQHLVYRGVAVG